MSKNPQKGAVACGHPATAEAVREVLADGGNAFDAALAGFCAATVAEPVLASLGGGGFLLARPAEGEARIYDFFVQTPRRRVPPNALDFYPIHADFGTATQEFHIGLGAMATPGGVAGLFAIHRDLATLPLARLVEPAARMARAGVAVRPIDAYVFRVVGPILRAGAACRALFTGPDGALLEAGERFANPRLADTLEALAREGARLFYEGDLGEALVESCRSGGGLLTAADLAGYRVARRRPLERRYRGATILTNPTPSSGGILIAFALALLAEQDFRPEDFGGARHLETLVRVMALTNRARIESRLHEASDAVEEEAAARRLFDPELLSAYAREVAGRPAASRGTTHISVIDASGNLASMSLSNGEGCGVLLGETGIILNNMLGEEDLNPRGFHAWHADCRLSSMMAPSLAFLADGSVAALGSGGSNRIRTAILQTLVNLIDFDCGAAEAVVAPRVHFENGLSNLEQDLGEAARHAVGAASERTTEWPRHSFFFGGVHCARRDHKGALEAAGDPRREGVALLA